MVRRSWVRSPLWPPAPHCQYYVTVRERSHGLPTLSRVWQHVILSDVSLGTRPRYSLVVDEEVKKPTKQPNKLIRTLSVIYSYIYNSLDLWYLEGRTYFDILLLGANDFTLLTTCHVILKLMLFFFKFPNASKMHQLQYYMAGGQKSEVIRTK